MKIILSVLLIIITSSVKYDQPTTMNKEVSCFSETNFDIVYRYLQEQIRKADKNYYVHGNRALYVLNSPETYGKEIILTDKGYTYTLAAINKEKGIFALAKMLEDNKRLVQEANQIFCEILQLSISSAHQ